MFRGSPRIPVDIYLIQITILSLKSSALPEPVNKPEHKLAVFDHINQTLQNNGFSMHMCSSQGAYLGRGIEPWPPLWVARIA